MLDLPLWLGFGIGVIVLITAVLTSLYIQKRAFYRRNEAGMEEFSSFSASVGSMIFERILQVVSLLCMLGGLFLSIYYGNKWFF